MINDTFGSEFTARDVYEWDFCRALGLHPADAAEVKHKISLPGLAASLAVYPGAVDGVRALQRVSEIYIVTSPWNSNPTWVHERETWLKHHFDIKPSNIIHTSAKHVCIGDALVDDKTETCEVWRQAHPSSMAVQWGNPHNRRDAWDGLSISSWGDLVGLIADLP